MPECMARFRAMLGEEGMANVLGIKPNAEGVPDSLMEQFECGEVTAEVFVDTILHHAQEGTTRQQVIDAWNAMHAGIPAERWAMVEEWKRQGHRLVMLSNNNELHWADVHRHYDLSLFEQTFASHLVHCSKPQRGIYEVVQKYLMDNDYAQPYYFVDDLAANRQTAEQLFGWITYPTLDALQQAMRLV